MIYRISIKSVVQNSSIYSTLFSTLLLDHVRALLHRDNRLLSTHLVYVTKYLKSIHTKRINSLSTQGEKIIYQSLRYAKIFLMFSKKIQRTVDINNSIIV